MARKATKKKAKRVLTAAQRRKYAKAAKAKRKAAAKAIDEIGTVSLERENASGSSSQKVTLSDKLRAAEFQRDTALNDAAEERKMRQDLRTQHADELAKISQQKNGEITGLQSEISFLRSSLARMTFGGVHVRNVERVGPGAV